MTEPASVRDEAMRAFISSLSQLTGSAPVLGLERPRPHRACHRRRRRTRQIILRCGARPDVIMPPEVSASATPSDGAIPIELEPHELPLVLWGRCPARLRDPNANAQTLDDALRHMLIDA